MKIIIDSTTYTKINNLSFDPDADITGMQVIINQFVADIFTTNNIAAGSTATLIDDSNNVWAKYWVVKAERKDREVIRIECQSVLMLLDRITLPAKMYANTSISTAFSEIFAQISAIYGAANIYTLDASFVDTISGYAPEQTARERFQWLCFCIGAYVKSFFSNTIDILPVDDTPELIPIDKVYWKPQINYDDYVTSIKVTAYSYTQGTPQTTDAYVEVNGTYYIETSQQFTLNNPDVPVTMSDNVIEVKDVKIVNSDNVSDILTRLSTYYFVRESIDAEIIDNGEFQPGKRYIINTDESALAAGYLKSASFTFGLQAKAKIKFSQSETINGKRLTIQYKCYDLDNVLIRSRTYFLPVGYQYEIENPYLMQGLNGHQYCFIPDNDETTGTIPNADSTVQENVSVALDLYQGILSVLSVTDVEQSQEVVDIG